jgi:hypothetical protein
MKMATDAPQISFMSPLVQELLERFERTVFPENGFEECEADVGRKYNDGFKKPYVCGLIKDVLSGRWKLGTTQGDISERIGTGDRSWVSRALRGGQMSLDVFLRLRVCPSRPEDWEPDIEGLYREMERSAFISVAQMLSGYVTDRQFIGLQQLDELNYELVCEIFARLQYWLTRSLAKDRNAACQIVRNVCGDPRRKVCPTWYLERQQRRIKIEMSRLCQEPDAAFEHLRRLQENWLDVFVATHFLLEQVKWKR